MKKRYFGWEYVFEFIWQHCDNDGLWDGDDDSIAVAFGVTEDEAHEMLVQLCQRHLIEKIFPGTFAIMRWEERDDSGEGEFN
jgi:hypothetical protein